MDTLDKFFRIIAFIALVLGLAGLAFGIVAFNKAAQANSVSASQNREIIAGLQEQVMSLTKQYTGLNNLQDAVAQTRQGIETLTGQLSEARAQLSAEAGKISGLEARFGLGNRAQGGAPAPAATVPPPHPAPNQLTPAADGSGRVQYTIQSGDTLSKVARNFGISLDSLRQANPRIEPRYLKVGQIIYIPKETP